MPCRVVLHVLCCVVLCCVVLCCVVLCCVVLCCVVLCCVVLCCVVLCCVVLCCVVLCCVVLLLCCFALRSVALCCAGVGCCCTLTGKSLSNLRRQRERERHQTKGVMCRTVTLHVRFKSWHISWPFSVQQHWKKIKFRVI